MQRHAGLHQRLAPQGPCEKTETRRMKILILGASYGSLLSTKLLMAGHDVTLVCTAAEAALINDEGTVVRIQVRGEDTPRLIASGSLPGKLDACTPDDADPADYDMVAMAMQEPQYRAAEVRALLARIGASRKPCLSIMNMPPLPYLKRIPGLDHQALEERLHRPPGLGRAGTGQGLALLTRSPGLPSAGRKAELSARWPADELQGRRLRRPRRHRASAETRNRYPGRAP